MKCNLESLNMLRDLYNFSTYRSILCLNGDLPPLSFFKKSKLPIIAADGAANSLEVLGLEPELIIGDLDSVNSNLLEKHSFLHKFCQNTNDYQKCLVHMQKSNLIPSIVVGVNGGHLDHILNNINLFIETNCLLYAPPLTGFVIKEKSTLELSLPLDTKISFFGIPKAKLSSKGLKWDLDKSILSFPGPTSCFNRSIAQDVIIQIHSGTLLVLIHSELNLSNVHCRQYSSPTRK